MIGRFSGSSGIDNTPLTPQKLDPDPYSLANILIYVNRNTLAQSGTSPCPATQLNVSSGRYFNWRR